MGVWDITTPLGSESKSLGDDRIREMKAAIQEALRGGAAEGTEAVFPGTAAASAPVHRYRGLKGATGDRPTSGQYGLYFDTTRNALQRDNGSSWDDIGTVIPSGTVMVFCQAAAPAGWTKLTTQNDKALRVVSGSGGGSGGTVAFSTSLAHTHTVNSHTHDMGNHTHSTPSHQHQLDHDLTNPGLSSSLTTDIYSANTDGARLGRPSGGSATVRAIKNQTENSGSGTSGTPSTNTTSATSPGTDSQLGAFAYVDVILCSKD